MRILISADMEGATGVTCGADVLPQTDQWQRFRALLTRDVNACVAGLFDGGATEVLVNEAHSSQRNVLLEELDPRARMLTGRHKPLSMMQGIDTGVDGVVFLGYHTGAGAEGVLAHTYLENAITEVRLDGVPASEGRLNATLAAEHGVPVLLVTGDDLTCADASGYAPRARHAPVKEAVSRYAAICAAPAVTEELIRTEAAASVAHAGRGRGDASAHTVEVDFDASHLALTAANVPTVSQVGTTTVRFTSESMTEAMKAFKVVTTVAAAAMEGHFG